MAVNVQRSLHAKVFTPCSIRNPRFALAMIASVIASATAANAASPYNRLTGGLTTLDPNGGVMTTILNITVPAGTWARLLRQGWL